MPSQFRKGEYGPPLAMASVTVSPMARLPATTARQIEEGLQLETARGVVITKVTRVYKLRQDGPDYVFLEDGRICPPTNLTSTLTNLASSLEVRQEMNLKSKRPVNYKTEMSYEKLGLRSEDR
jgi:quinolinate synthase